MCLLIAKPAGKQVPEAYIRQAAKRNDDGYGIVWHNGTALQMWKHLSDLEATIAKVNELKDFPALIHLRFATHGVVDVHNIHPFYVDDDRTIAMAHNGQLDIEKNDWPDIAIAASADAWNDPIFVRQMCKVMFKEKLSIKDPESDTKLFAEHVLKHLDPKERWWTDKHIMEEIKLLVGTDRMAFLTLKDGIVLVDSTRFIEEGGVYYSNGMYKPPFEQRDRVADDVHANADWWKQKTALPVLAKNVDEVTGFPKIDPYVPLDDDDFLVAYFFTPDDRRSYVQCVSCRKDRPGDMEAHGIFKSDLEFILPETCSECKKELSVIADAVEEMLAVIAQIGGDAPDDQNDAGADIDYGPCVVCGKSQCDCTVADVFDETKPHLSTLADVLAMPGDALLGMSRLQLQSIAKELQEKGEDINTMTLLEASENYPELFEQFAA